jgi:hypothetical protein
MGITTFALLMRNKALLPVAGSGELGAGNFLFHSQCKIIQQHHPAG